MNYYRLIAFRQGPINLYPHEECKRVPVFPTSYKQQLSLFNGDEVLPCFMAIDIVSFVNCFVNYLSSLVNFSLREFVFLLLISKYRLLIRDILFLI